MNGFRSYLTELFEQPWLHIDTTQYARDGLSSVNYIYADPRNPKDYTKYLMVIFEQQNKYDKKQIYFPKNLQYCIF